MSYWLLFHGCRRIEEYRDMTGIKEAGLIWTAVGFDQRNHILERVSNNALNERISESNDDEDILPFIEREWEELTDFERNHLKRPIERFIIDRRAGEI